MEWNQLLSSKRLGRETETVVERGTRTEFDSDIGRITFSGAFRRLSRKAQVHPLAANDHIHTRLTHTMEVAHVGRALGKELGSRIARELPSAYSADDLGTVVHAACLAHDLGNPPFGHAGEDAMASWFEVNGPDLFKYLSPEHKHDLISVEGNAQGFRQVTQTENVLWHGGLQLTYSTLGAFHKYPWSSRKPGKKFGSFIAEEDILDRIGEELGLVSRGYHVWCRHPLAHLVEAADDICYSIIDLEDAVELKIYRFEEVAEVLLAPFDECKKAEIRSRFINGNSHRNNFARLRGPMFDVAISGAIEAYMKNYEDIMAGNCDKNLLLDLLDVNDVRRILIKSAKELGQKDIYTDIKKTEIEIGCYSSFDTLLSEFCAAALNQAEVLNNPEGEAKLKWKSQHVLRLLGDHAPSPDNAPPPGNWSSYQCLRRVIDFVSGMTDNYAVYISRQLQGMGFAGIQRP